MNSFHKTSKTHQDPIITLSTCTKHYSSLSHFVKDNKKHFDDIEQEHRLVYIVRLQFYKEKKECEKEKVKDGSAPNVDEKLF